MEEEAKEEFRLTPEQVPLILLGGICLAGDVMAWSFNQLVARGERAVRPLDDALHMALAQFRLTPNAPDQGKPFWGYAGHFADGLPSPRDVHRLQIEIEHLDDTLDRLDS